MVISKNQVVAALPSILTEEIRTVIQNGIENGLALCDKLDADNRDALEEFASNTNTRNLFSSLCIELKRAIAASTCRLSACAHKKTSTTYIEITSPNLIMHLRNEISALPQYAKDELSKNADFSPETPNYIQIVYKATDGEILKELAYLVMDENGKEVYREPIEGSWSEVSIPA